MTANLPAPSTYPVSPGWLGVNPHHLAYVTGSGLSSCSVLTLASGLFSGQVMPPCIKTLQGPAFPLLHCWPHPLLRSHRCPLFPGRAPATGPLHALWFSQGNWFPDGHMATLPTVLRSVQ